MKVIQSTLIEFYHCPSQGFLLMEWCELTLASFLVLYTFFYLTIGVLILMLLQKYKINI